MSKSKGWPVLGLICKGENGSYIKLNDNVTILIDGKEVPIAKSKKGNRNLNLDSPVAKTERMINAGAIDESDVESAREKAKSVNEWLKYEIVLPPPRD